MATDRINNDQRKALVKVVSEKIDQKIAQVREAQEELKQRVHQELGADEIDQKIEELHQKIDSLNAKKRSLGFNTYGKFTKDSEADKLFNKYLASAPNLSVDSLRHQKAKVISSIWTATSLSKAKELVNSVLN